MLALLSTLALAAPANLARCTDAAPTLPAAMSDVFKRVVRIETSNGSGSGVVVSPDGFVLTAAHVVRGASKPKVFFADETSVDAEVLRSNGGADLALLRVPGVKLPCLPVADARLAPAADTWIVGSPGGKALTGSVTKGIISGYREREGWAVVQTDASINPGNSGGPLLGADGRVQAIVSYKVAGIAQEGLGFAVSVEVLEKALDVRFSDTTDTTIPPMDQKGNPLAASFPMAPPVITNRPTTPGPLPRGNVCADATVGRDPFDRSKASFSAKAADIFELTWTSGSAPVFTAFLTIAGDTNDIAWSDSTYGPGGLALDILLTDDTRIRLVSDGGNARMSGLLPVIAAKFTIDAATAEAIASAGPSIIRWNVAGSDVPIDQDRSERQRDKYYRPLFACLAKEMAAK
jgi:hypothetical protein